MLTSSAQLNEHQLKDLEELSALCRKVDGSIPNLFTHILAKPRALPAALLFYDNNKLIAFLSAFFFFETAVEVAVLVAPEARRKGIARELIRLIKPLLLTYNFNTLIFSSPADQNTKWLTEKGFKFQHREYHMQREDLSPLLNFRSKLLFRPPTPADIPALQKMDRLCFGKKLSETKERYQLLLADRSYHLIVALQDKVPVGKAHMRWEDSKVILSDIVILPRLQGKGLGTQLIAYCINFALSEGKSLIALDVETNNKRALDLYIRLGFLVQNACDYWKIGINDLN